MSPHTFVRSGRLHLSTLSTCSESCFIRPSAGLSPELGGDVGETRGFRAEAPSVSCPGFSLPDEGRPCVSAPCRLPKQFPGRPVGERGAGGAPLCRSDPLRSALFLQFVNTMAFWYRAQVGMLFFVTSQVVNIFWLRGSDFSRLSCSSM